MCTVIQDKFILKEKQTAYSVKVKILIDEYEGVFFGFQGYYKLGKKYEASKPRYWCEPGFGLVTGDYFHLFSDLNNAKKFKKILVDSCLRPKWAMVILEVEIPKTTEVVIGPIEEGLYGQGLQTICARTISFRKEIK